MRDVLMLLKTNGLKYDDRVKKECLTLTKFGFQTEILVLENSNVNASGSIYINETKFHSYNLWLRSITKGNSFLLFKLIEWFFKMVPRIHKSREIVWIHDPLLFIFIPYFYLLKKIGLIRKLVWDLHELPPEHMFENFFLSRLFKMSLKLSDSVIHANRERAEYLNKKLNIDNDYYVVRNFVGNDFIDEKPKAISDELNWWLEGTDYILVQSGLYEERCFSTIASALCREGKRKCVVLGGYKESYLNELRKTYHNFDQVFFLVGMVEQLRIVDYISGALCSIIFYDSKTKNSELCEPNRLYYSFVKNVPVVVGNNPPMKEFVERNKVGFVMKDCGTDASELLFFLKKIKNTKFSAVDIDSVSWSSQEDTIFEIVNHD